MKFKKFVICWVLAFTAYAANAEVESLRNDSYSPGNDVTFLAGFQLGELVASRFVPQIECPCLVSDVSLLFGGNTNTQSIGIKIWEDPDGLNVPSTLLRHESRTLTASNSDVQVIDMTASSVVVNGPFRVGFQILHTGLPGLAADSDGVSSENTNFVLMNVGTYDWFPAASENISGDFVIRASIDNFVLADVDNDGFANEIDNCVQKPNSDQRDSDNDSVGNVCDPDVATPNDCQVNFLDFAVYRDNFQIEGDLDTDNNVDGITNFIDFAVFANYFLTAPGPSALGCDQNSN